jgi:hypothetical protein
MQARNDLRKAFLKLKTAHNDRPVEHRIDDLVWAAVTTALCGNSACLPMDWRANSGNGHQRANAVIAEHHGSRAIGQLDATQALRIAIAWAQETVHGIAPIEVSHVRHPGI